MFNIVGALVAIEVFYFGLRYGCMHSCHVQFHSLSLVGFECTDGAGEAENPIVNGLFVASYRLAAAADVATFFTFQVDSAHGVDILLLDLVFILRLLFAFPVFNI